MKSFLRFFIIAAVPLLFIAITDVIIYSNLDDLKNRYAVFSSIGFFLIFSFVFVYIFENNLFKKYSFFRSLIFSSLVLFGLIFLFSILNSYFFWSKIHFKIPFFQSTLFVGFFVLFGFIVYLKKVLKSDNKLIFNQSTSYYIKILALMSFTLFIFITILFGDYVWYDFTLKQVIDILLKLILFCFAIVILSFSIQYYLAKYTFFQQNILLTLLTSVVLSSTILVTVINNFFKYIYIGILYVGLIALFCNLAIVIIVVVKNNTDKLKNEIDALSNSVLKKESEYLQLKQQVNPHFLFNNLNTLISFIEINPKKAIEFGHHLSNTYRHYLKHQEEDFVLLSDEINFIKEYLEIYKAKFENGFSFKIDIETSDNHYILSLALQEIIDNIFKHNTLDEQNPIEITIFILNDSLCISNSVTFKSSMTTTKMGLENIKSRYQLLTDKMVRITESGTHFEVVIPILNLA